MMIECSFIAAIFPADRDRVKAEILRVKRELVAAKKKSGLHDDDDGVKQSKAQSETRGAVCATTPAMALGDREEKESMPLWKRERLQYLRSSKAMTGKRSKTEQSQHQVRGMIVADTMHTLHLAS